MPELPEVEATAQFLRERLVGHTVLGAQLLWHRTLHGGAEKSFIQKIVGSLINSVSRRGKFVVIDLESSGQTFYMLFHLRMSGSIDVVSHALPVEPHDRLILELDKQRDLRFNDVRKFGRCYLVDDLAEITGTLGPEPLLPAFSSEALFELLRTRRGRIKPTLLDQTIVAGIGNIYADEALWLAKIHPTKTCSTISRAQCEALWSSIREVLREAIGKLGTDFGDGVVYGGMYSPKVYGRYGKSCVRCSTDIKRIVVNQRSSHFCPKCQRLT